MNKIKLSLIAISLATITTGCFSDSNENEKTTPKENVKPQVNKEEQSKKLNELTKALEIELEKRYYKEPKKVAPIAAKEAIDLGINNIKELVAWWDLGAQLESVTSVRKKSVYLKSWLDFKFKTPQEFQEYKESVIEDNRNLKGIIGRRGNVEGEYEIQRVAYNEMTQYSQAGMQLKDVKLIKKVLKKFEIKYDYSDLVEYHKALAYHNPNYSKDSEQFDKDFTYIINRFQSDKLDIKALKIGIIGKESFENTANKIQAIFGCKWCQVEEMFNFLRKYKPETKEDYTLDAFMKIVKK